MATISTLVVALTARTTEFERGLKSAERSLDRTASRIGSLGAAMSVGLTAPILGIGGAAVKMALDFEDSFSKLQSLLGLSAQETERLKQGVLSLAGATAQAPKDLAEALVKIEEAGIRGQQAMEVLKASAMASSAGLGGLQQIAGIVTAEMNAYGPAAMSAGQATGVLLRAVREAHVGGDELAGSLGNLIPLAAATGVSFDQLVAAVASMTHNGMEAGTAAGALKSVLSTLEKPSKAAQEALAEAGLSAAGLRQELQEKGLLAVLQTLSQHLDENEGALQQVFPNMRAMAGVVSLLGKQSKDTAGIFRALAGATSGDLNRAFSAAADTAGFKFKQALAELQVVLIRLGDQILPAIVPAVQLVAGVLERLGGQFAQLSPSTRDLAVVLGLLAAAAGPAMIALSSLYQAAATVVGVMRLLAAAAAGVGVGILLAGSLGAAAAYLWISKWEELKTDMGVIFSFLLEKIEGVLAALGRLHGALGALASLAASVLPSVRSAADAAFGGMATGAAAAGAKISSVGAMIKADFGGALDATLAKAQAWSTGVVGAVQGAAATVKPALASMEPAAKAAGQAAQPAIGFWGQLSSAMQKDGSTVKAVMGSLRGEAITAGSTFNSKVVGMANSAQQSMGAMTAAWLRGKMSFQDFAKGMEQQIAELIVKILLLKALTAVGFGGPFGAGFVGGMSGMFSGHAEGGRPTVGQVSVVGEKGPELFVPDTAGTIVPNSKLGGGGGHNITVGNNVSITGLDLAHPAAAAQIIKGLKDELTNGTTDAVTFAIRAGNLAAANPNRAA